MARLSMLRPALAPQPRAPEPWRRDERATRQARGYGTAWEQARKRVLMRDCGLCQPCAREGRVNAAHAVDHIIPKSQGGTDDESNLRAICEACHALKTLAESKRARGVE